MVAVNVNVYGMRDSLERARQQRPNASPRIAPSSTFHHHKLAGSSAHDIRGAVRPALPSRHPAAVAAADCRPYNTWRIKQLRRRGVGRALLIFTGWSGMLMVNVIA
jgi:hypothetical protein